jgi:hypothetical protein
MDDGIALPPTCPAGSLITPPVRWVASFNSPPVLAIRDVAPAPLRDHRSAPRLLPHWVAGALRFPRLARFRLKASVDGSRLGRSETGFGRDRSQEPHPPLGRGRRLTAPSRSVLGGAVRVRKGFGLLHDLARLIKRGLSGSVPPTLGTLATERSPRRTGIAEHDFRGCSVEPLLREDPVEKSNGRKLSESFHGDCYARRPFSY